MTKDKLIAVTSNLNYLWGMTNMLLKMSCPDKDIEEIVNSMFSEIEDYLMESEEDD